MGVVRKPSKTEYHIHRFMYDLGIKGSVLTVYAALYSFTLGERGVYHGSAKYLALSLDVCERTVLRAYKRLRELGLIENGESEDGWFKGIRCVDPASLKKNIRKDAEVKRMRKDPVPADEEKAETATEEESHAEREESCEKDTPGIDFFDGRALAEDIPEHEKNTIRMMNKYEKKGDNRRFLCFGKKGNVRMTEPQYKRLNELLPCEELIPYFVKLEIMLDENVKTGKAPPHSHYKTLRKWIEEDLAV